MWRFEHLYNTLSIYSPHHVVTFKYTCDLHMLNNTRKVQLTKATLAPEYYYASKSSPANALSSLLHSHSK